ncbi:MAG TPA: nickel pincer cofactor biosynthesis protein LarC [Chloroflexi bacterium]|nr:nickel pincer cofactor biosynthesis protein LarC [Chloroflexota bacterium]
MKIAYFDCFSGISGNMVLGALLDLGLELGALKEALAGLEVSGYEIEARKVLKRHIAGTLVDVKVQEEGVERHLDDILEIIEKSALPEDVKETCGRIFTRLAEAEARVHRVDIKDIHFHEVGGIDAIVDVVGSVVGLKLLGIEEVYSSPLHLGRGFVECAHGKLPVPAPATLELVKGVPVYGRDIEAELVTPTGAAIITTLARGFGPSPAMEIEAIGYGAGHKDLPIPNLLRVSIGRTRRPEEGGYEEDVVIVVEANIDDMNPELYEHVMDKLFEKGALDVFLTPIQMKKNRPAVKLSAIVREADLSGVLDAFFDETTTLGVRLYEVRRKKLSREATVVETKYGKISVKVGKLGSIVKNISPEYEDCRRIASQLGIPLKEVYEEARRAARGHFCPEHEVQGD